jgi:hypothetical protein
MQFHGVVDSPPFRKRSNILTVGWSAFTSCTSSCRGGVRDSSSAWDTWDSPILRLALSGGIRSARGVGDFTDELFENVFECNQSSGLAVLVDQASEM